MDKNLDNKIITKSPGKSLLSGGYLILDKSKRGLVINIDAYITCKSFYLIKPKEREKVYNILLVNIYSDYLKQTFNYNIFIKSNNNKEIEFEISEKNNNDNKWIKNSIISSLIFYLSYFDYLNNLINDKNIIEINIRTESDYKFYSYSKDNVSKNVKTGLGSSSAFINSLTTNLILIYDSYFRGKKYKKTVIKKIDDENIKAIILGSCLLSNNLSQNKIGSCFDIISSLFGSQIFSQTKQNIFLDYPCKLNDEVKTKVNNLISYLKSDYIPNIFYFNEKNEYSQNKIFFISIEIGSDTRIFVKKVLDYANNKKKEKLFDDELFSKLNEFNEKIINIFLKGINDNTILLKESCINYRNILRKISEESHVDIEPKILTSLLNNLIKNNNINYAISPGAGGYDSIIIIAKQKINNIDLIKEINDIINNFNIENKNKKLNIKANIFQVNFPKAPGTIIL